MRMLMLLALLCACDRTDDEIRAAVTLVVSHEGSQAMAAADRVARHGRRALPMVEAALHTASPSGKKNLIVTLRKIGDIEAVPLLRHLAAFDPAPDVRREAEWTLKQWAAGEGARADEARKAVRVIEEQRQSEESG